MTKAITQQIKAYKFDIAQTNKDGSFSCPNCGIKISPDDRTDSKYAIYDTKMREDILCEVIISCKRCLSLTHLIIKNEGKQLANAEDERLYIDHI